MTSATSPFEPEYRNCFVVRSAARHVTQFYDQLLAPVGLHVTQFSILATLKRLGPMTINALAKEMVMDRTTLGRNVQSLERDGLIKIEASGTDGGAKELHLTKARPCARGSNPGHATPDSCDFGLGELFSKQKPPNPSWLEAVWRMGDLGPKARAK